MRQLPIKFLGLLFSDILNFDVVYNNSNLFFILFHLFSNVLHARKTNDATPTEKTARRPFRNVNKNSWNTHAYCTRHIFILSKKFHDIYFRKDSEDVEYQSHVKSYFSQSRIAPSPLVGGCKSFIPGAGMSDLIP